MCGCSCRILVICHVCDTIYCIAAAVVIVVVVVVVVVV